MKMNMSRLTIVVAVCAWPAQIYATPFSLDFSGVHLVVIGEYINAVPVPIGSQEFAPIFLSGQTISGSIVYDTSQPDTDSDPNTGTYRIGALFLNIPELGLAASRHSSDMQISAFNNTEVPNDQFFAYVTGADSFSSSVGLPNPVSFSVDLFGDTSMLASDQLPASPLNWSYGSADLEFLASDGTTRQVNMIFSPVPEPTTLTLVVFGVASIVIRKRRKSAFQVALKSCQAV